ncbi:DUF2255 family protein [Chryseobacterium sp. SIMBA_028]|uniref:DUF2255 family protein n=1 Tax=Chryseobacterium sp. SIMBA_028 TaxID=3085771 RepID=UPI00397AF924
MNKDEVLNYIRTHTLIGIKAGSERPGFLEIWMVLAQDRIFARSWGLAERSWYTAFLKDPNGQIQCGNTIFNIKAVIPSDNEELTDKINQAYLTKYNIGRNRKYAIGIIQEKHIERTMEFIICD